MNNGFRVGTVSKTSAARGKMLVDVDVQGAELHDVPVKALANAFIKLFVPVLVGEQVFVFSEDGNLNKAYCVPSLFSIDVTEPQGGTESNVVLEVGSNRFDIGANAVRCKTPKFVIDGPLEVLGDVDIKANMRVVNVVASGTVVDSDGNNGA